jgi:DNA replication and repair protein RecF
VTTGSLPARTDAATSRLESLRLYAFRNYDELRLDLDPGLNVFVGENAQGKTNLLEAVATLFLTRSPRAGSGAEVIRWGASEAAVEAMVARPTSAQAYSMRLRLGEGGRVSRVTSVDGSVLHAREIVGRCPLVLFWPEDLQLVKAGPDGRRRLLDLISSQLDRRVAEDLVRYRRTLEQRNAALRQLRLGGGTWATVHSFDPELIERATRIHLARDALITALGPLAASAMGEISDGRERLELAYLPDGAPGGADAAAVGAALERSLIQSGDEEQARGVTVVGPHRDDLDVVLDGRPARSAASQGQQRSAVLAIKLAEVRHIDQAAQVSPILVLDDVLSELDAGRRARLLAGLGRSGDLQTLVTTTEADAVEAPAMRRFRVRRGTVEVE